jgi:hypothetical protein
VVYVDRILGAKSKGHNAAIKRAVKEYPLIISDILSNKRISSKRVPR